MNSTSRVLTQSNASFMSRVYLWMMFGLVISGLVAYGITSSPTMIASVLQNSWLMIALIIVQLAAVVAISGFVNRISATMTTLIYLLYCALSGVTFSVLLLVYTKQSIAQAFFISAFAFIGLSSFGYLTKRDLGPIGTFLITGLFGFFGFIVVGAIFPSLFSNTMMMAINAIGVLVFAGLTAYDTQRIKNFNVGMSSPDIAQKAAISGALMLYLDLINLFISLLRLFGDRR